MRRLLLFVAIMLFGTLSFAQSGDQDPVSLSQDLFQKLEKHYIKDSLVSWVPDGTQPSPTKPSCNPQVLEEALTKLTGLNQQRFTLISQFLERCGSYLARNSSSKMYDLIKLHRLSYDIESHPLIQPVRFSTGHNEAIEGYLALKPDQKERPFAIVQCGIFCKGQTRDVLAVLMHLFDEGPFNVLLLESQTYESNMSREKRVQVGGVYEGMQLFHLAKWLRFESPYRGLISNLHLVGLSLGGHAALYSSLFNDHNAISDDHKVFDSVFAYCPAVNLEVTLRDIYRKSIRGDLLSTLTQKQMRKVYDDVTDLHDLVQRNDYLEPSSIPNILALTSSRYLSRLRSHQFLQPFHNVSLSTPLQHWNANNFLKYSRGIETPTLVWASEDDWMIPQSENALALRTQHSNPKKGQLHVIASPKGNHCASGITYGWQTAGAIIRGYLLSYSFDIGIESRHLRDHFVDLPSPSLADTQRHVNQRWVVDASESTLFLSYRVWNSSKDYCREAGPYRAHSSCYQWKNYEVPWAQLDPLQKVKPPNTRVEAQALTRKLNTRWRLLDETKNILTGTRSKPHVLREVVYE